MIYIDKNKLTVDGVDVYPDHASPTQFWYIPGTIALAQRAGKSVLSYFWYTDSENDTDGTGFLNFEVNTSVPQATLDKIKAQLDLPAGTDRASIRLSTVPYQTGSVNFSVLGPMAAQAADASKDDTVVYQSAEQLVWRAGSSSLVGDNAAVCSVTFRKEGKLAAAMKAALQSKGQHIAAVYRLEFLAMRPSVSFKVTGEFKKTIEDFQASIGTQIPLEAFVLDLGINARWQKIMQNTDLKIEVVNYTGKGDAELEGLKWARQLLLDYVLKNFFEVQLGNDPNAWSPLKDEPKVDEAVQRSKATEVAAADKVEQDTAGEADSPEKSEQSAAAVKEIVKAATLMIPKVNIRASYYHGSQVNSIDFLYSEQNATTMVVLPQALVGLGPDEQAGEHITELNRAQDPFGRRYNVALSVPSADSQARLGLQTLNVEARYPVGSPKGKQAPYSLSINGGQTSGSNPFPFQYDGNGSAGVEYSADFVFAPDAGWDSDTYQYTLTGVTETGVVVAMAESVAEFLTINIELRADFVWNDAEQALVILSSKKWNGDKRVVIQKGKEAPQVLRIRSDAKFRAEAVSYRVELSKGNKTLFAYGPLPMQDKHIIVLDQYAEHIPVYFNARFDDDSVDVTLTYDDGGVVWEDQFSLDAGQTRVPRIVPAMKSIAQKRTLEAQYEIVYASGATARGTVKGGQSATIRAATGAIS
ncbi:hypothetical protein [Massilia sp. CCM 8734]|uniref:hypothetical protein n=1 Tax=Massilia sp. CCM 8734 TaxID=2609283 RepID=UPI0014229EEE|nr:hypothetical protein [Massilia sp. CCM 8734]NHZ94173.1 hypothetical protein [Massilia sp. CCM 8734]